MITQIKVGLRRLINTSILFKIMILIFTLLKPQSIYSEIYSELIYGTDSITGQWQDVILLDRKVKLADKIGQSAKIKIDIPEDDYYKIYLHLYYKWEETCPKIDFTIKNAGKEFTGAVNLETNRIAPEIGGRLVFKTLETTGPLYLTKGFAEINLTLKSITSFWKQNAELKNSNGVVAIDYIFIQPVIFKGGKAISLDIIEAESFRGNWRIENFDNSERTGILKTSSRNAVSNLTVYTPFSHLFDIYVLVKIKKKEVFIKGIQRLIQQKEQGLKIKICNNTFNFRKKISLNNLNSKWQLFNVGKIYLVKDRYQFSIISDNPFSNQISMDFFILIPIKNEKHAEM